ncbi:MAG TPA: AEC family transporter [Ignavibacteriaceae bacterium]|nr:AEC family transporter [Ignavibacteriaceae bacterium]
MIDNIIFTGNVVAPVFLLVALGYFVKRINVINENFVDVTSKFVFSVSLPALIFINISTIDLSSVIDLGQIFYIYAATLISFFIIWILSIPLIKDAKNLSVFVQGAYRSNYAIVGLAIISKLFGTSALGKASIILAFILPLYNVLAVIILTVPFRKERKLNLKATLVEIILNPLIVAVIIGLPFSYFKIRIPDVINLTTEFLAELALPLALIGIGGSLNMQNIRKASGLAFTSSAIKIILIPVILTLGSYYFGYRGLDLGIMFVLFSCPTAIVSFIMAEAMGANSKLAGNIVLISTVASVFTIAAGIVILKELSLI